MATTPKRISALTSATTPLGGTEVAAIVQSGTTKKVAVSDIAALTYTFKTIDCPSGTDPVADSSTDTLTLAAGTNVTITGDSSTDTVTWSVSRPVVHVREEQTAGTEGGTFTSGSWQTRTLNTEKLNSISGASLSTNQVTLPAGNYYVRAAAPGFRVQRHQARLRNVTDGTTAIVGNSSYCYNSNFSGTIAYLQGYFTIAASKAFELQHRCETTQATNGYGLAVNWDEVEVYGDLWIEKVP